MSANSETPQKRTLSFQEVTILEALRNTLSEQVTRFNDLDNKAQTVISSSSIVLTVLVALSTVSGQQLERNTVNVGLVAYVVTLLASVGAMLFARNRLKRLPATFERGQTGIKEALALGDEQFFESVLDAYLNAVEINRKVLSGKEIRVFIAYAVFGGGVVATVFLIAQSL